LVGERKKKLRGKDVHFGSVREKRIHLDNEKKGGGGGGGGGGGDLLGRCSGQRDGDEKKKT